MTEQGSGAELRLAGEFPAPTREQWRALVDGVLKGAPFERLVTRTYDGIAIQPLYTADDPVPPPGRPGAAPFVRGSHARGQLGGWDVRQYVAEPDPSVANDAILSDLERGATSIWLRVGDGGTAPADLDAALAGVYVDLAPIELEPAGDPVAAVGALERLWQAVPASEVRGCLGLDPLNGRASESFAFDRARDCARRYGDVRALVVDGGVAHERGAADVEELAVAIAGGVAYLRSLTAVGLSEAEAFAQIEFRLSASDDQFSTVAKLRAARRLWSMVAQHCGVEDAVMRQHAVTSRAMMTQRDPWVNIVRTAIAAFAAGVGGADSVTVLPFDDAIGRADRFSRRLARNTQALLLDETNLARVVDPAGGSWYVEALTDEMARAAWAWFRDIERAGGLGTAAGRAAVSERIERTRAARQANVARRKDVIIGVSEFPNLAEEPLLRAPSPRDAVERYAAPFERLRDRADRIGQQGARPAIFIANLEPVARHAARAAFAKNFFEIAGIVALDNDGFDGPTEAAAGFAASGAPLAVICAGDKVYDNVAEDAARRLKAAGARRVYLAGNPGDKKDRYGAAGIDDFVFVGCDALAVLTNVLDDWSA